jgi:crotonobetainyl-CoA:carnitine CoA-transferase CaiB-like acyl-CoA transferase
MDELAGLDVCVGPVNDFTETFADPQVRARDMAVDTDIEGVGPWTYVGNPIRLDGSPGRVDRSPPPRLGEHTEALLSEAGLGAADIEELRASGSI